MAKTIEQIQEMITSGESIRLIINEIADYLQANPSGGGGVTMEQVQAAIDAAITEFLEP